MKNVRCFPHMGRKELDEVIKWSHFTVVPSEWYENCPMTVLESFASGKAVIGSDIGGMPDLIDNGVNGLLFRAGSAQDLAEKIDFLIKDDSRVVEMGKNARRKVEEKYNKEAHYELLMEVYRMIIRER